MREIVGILPEFNPLKGNLTAEQFINKIEQLRLIYLWSEDEILFASQHKLKVVAADWADAQPPFSSWPLFVGALKADFPSEVNVAEVHREMDRRKRKHNESMKDYYYNMLNMGRRANMDQASINSYIIGGLNDVNLSRTLLAINLKTCNDLLKDIEGLSATSVGVKPTFNAQQQQQQRQSEAGEAQVRKAVRCFNCNEVGHIAAKCPQPSRRPRCSKCNKMGHEAKACNVSKSTLASLAEPYTIPPPFMKTVEIWGKVMSAFVDTGSDYSLVATNVIPSDVQREHEVHKLTGFGGGVVETREKVRANAAVDGRRVEVSLLVAPECFMPYQILLGRDMLGDARVVIDSGVMKIEAADSYSSVNRLCKDVDHEGVQ
ncbi:uncharacterized protein LOC118749995 [Rhagoletis pomonella]|uniref:uncharacterized protein LOC118749995 n=1 Tax=Rhagoletis pomonella TaxID=28610 RepID=UPI001783BE69|nr:uncharacterized protein LOC118749995 [Rhagoletis pomonella]